MNKKQIKLDFLKWLHPSSLGTVTEVRDAELGLVIK